MHKKLDSLIPPPSEVVLENTDLGNAKRLVRQYGKDIRYVHEWQTWLIWEEDQWRRDNDGAIMRLAKATTEEMFIEAAKINDDARRNDLRKQALRSQSAQRLQAMVKLAESEKEVVLSADKIDSDPLMLGVQNGVLDLRTGKFGPASREDYITKRAGVPYDKAATCPEWLSFLRKFFPGDKEIIPYLQRVAGYLLTGLSIEEVLFILWGDGANGKSTFRETLFALMGDYAVGADASLLITNDKKGGGATPDVARLHGARMVTINETNQGDKLNVARMKFLTSGKDKITARNLYERPFDFTPSHKTFLTTNNKPIVRSNDEGTWRRIHFMAFLFRIPDGEKDVDFLSKVLIPELPGILNWALAGLKAYRKETLSPPASVLSSTKDYRDDMDVFGQWIEDRCALATNVKTNQKTLFDDYRAWSADSWHMTKIQFGRELIRRGFAKVKDGEVKHLGLRLKGAL